MVKEIGRTPSDCGEKVLVCITAQSNSRRLICIAAKTADEVNGELHVLHVEKGNNIFQNENSPKLLEELFAFATEQGGMVHVYCDDNIPQSIADFIAREKITRLVLGEPPKEFAKGAGKNSRNELTHILAAMPQRVEVLIVKREEEFPDGK